LTRYELHADGYSLYAGTIEPRKNIDTLLDAYSSLSPSLRNRIPLVLCGYRGWGGEKLHVRIESAVREGWVKFLGYVPDYDLPKLFSGARLFVFPSLYEGFGLPVLEAMSSGTPVISSNAASLPEVAGDAATLFNPLDAEALRELLTQGLEDKDWRQAARHKGLLRAKEFSWEKCAEKTLSVYKELTPSTL
jgi:alpha-1,3-rhamnosyl/mannosyltransferase